MIHEFDFVDLKSFERRLTEVIAQTHPAAARWRSKFCFIVLNVQYTVQQATAVSRLSYFHLNAQ